MKKILLPVFFVLFILEVWSGPPSRFHSFAQVGDGGGIRTTFLLINQGSSTVAAEVIFASQEGAPFSVTLNGQTDSSFSIEIPAGGAVKLTTSGEGDQVRSGWASLEADGEIGAQLFFEIFSAGSLATQAAIEPNTGFKRADLFVNQQGRTRTGVAIANETGGQIAVRVTLTDQTGIELDQKVITLEAQSQISQFVDEFFPGVEITQGRLNLNSSGPFSVTTLQQTGFVLATLPPIEAS